MPRYCSLGSNCVGPSKVKAPAGYMSGILPGPPYNRNQHFCSAPCKAKWDRENVRAKRAALKAKTQAKAENDRVASHKAITKLKKKGHTCCPDCERPFEE